jgi:hypothetical protein
MTTYPTAQTLPENLAFLNPVLVDDLARFGKSNDGGYVLPAQDLNQIDALVSFGLSQDWSFEKHLKEIRPHILIQVYDHTVNARVFLKGVVWELIRVMLLRSNVTELISRMKTYFSYKTFFSNDCIHYQERVFSRIDLECDATIQKVFSRIEGVANVLLKMDIEGGEYRVIPQILEFSNRINVMLIEFHDTEPYREIFARQVKQILTDFEIVHIHGNNFRGVAADGLPEALEITFLNKKLVETKVHRRNDLPLSGVDFPNDPSTADLPLKFC